MSDHRSDLIHGDSLTNQRLAANATNGMEHQTTLYVEQQSIHIVITDLKYISHKVHGIIGIETTSNHVLVQFHDIHDDSPYGYIIHDKL
jgi:hypothetical protein